MELTSLELEDADRRRKVYVGIAAVAILTVLAEHSAHQHLIQQIFQSEKFAEKDLNLVIISYSALLLSIYSFLKAQLEFEEVELNLELAHHDKLRELLKSPQKEKPLWNQMYVREKPKKTKGFSHRTARRN